MRRYVILFTLILALTRVGTAQAHAADMYFHTHTVRLSPDGMRITWELLPGTMMVQSVWFEADQDSDGLVSGEEARAWTTAYAQSSRATLDGKALALSFEAVDWPGSLTAFYEGEPIRIHLQAEWAVALGEAHPLELQITPHERFTPKNSMDWFVLHGEEGVSFDTPAQNLGLLSLTFYTSAPAEEEARLYTWESGKPSLPWVVESLGLGELAAAASEETANPSYTSSILEGLLKKPESTTLFLPAALGVAVLLGALHALSPGHGKTIVAAYLVGSQGKYYHALALGLLVTMTHTGSVLALGLLTLTASRYLLASQLFPVLEMASGVLILVLGLGLLIPRLREWQAARRRQNQYRAPAAVRMTEAGREQLLLNQPIEENEPAHSHDPSSLGYIPRKPQPGSPLAGIRWRSLVALGISGGLVPCPDAIAILLIAVTINRIALGMVLIAAFSLGLAIVLIAIGMLVLQGKRLFAHLRWFERAAYSVPVLSALVVFGLGGILTWNAYGRIDSLTAQSDEQTLSIARAAQFDMQESNVIYIAPDEAGRQQLFTVSAAGGNPEQLTYEATGIWEYALSPDRSVLFYNTYDGEETSRIWRLSPSSKELSLALECVGAICSAPVWQPDGKGLLYNRMELYTLASGTGFSSIWWAELATGETAPLFQDANLPGYNPAWSPNGKWFSYVSVNPQEYQLYQTDGDLRHTLPTQTGVQLVWSPEGEALLMVDVTQMDGLYLTKLFHFALANEQLTRLSDDPTLDENYPSWSPDGEWIAVVRSQYQSGMPTSGSQMWLMRPDGSDAHPLTQEAQTYYGQPVWSPDSRYLLYSATVIDSGKAFSGITILDVESSEARKITEVGNHPDWLP